MENEVNYQNCRPSLPDKLPAINIPQLLRIYDLRPDKRLGQNFLIDPSALKKVVEAAELEPGETVLEIGSGLGSLTRLLALEAARVITVELDSRLIAPLKDVLSSFSNVEIIQGDILSFRPEQLVKTESDDAQTYYSVVANIPYQITSALIRHLLEAAFPPRKLVLTIQKEVAERICVKTGKMNLLALSVQVYGEPKLVVKIPAGAFYPTPKVDSAVVRVDLHAQPFLPSNISKIFFQLARAGFSQKRKTLRNALSAGMHWKKNQTKSILNSAGIDSQRRAETLTIEEWLILARDVSQKGIKPK